MPNDSGSGPHLVCSQDFAKPQPVEYVRSYYDITPKFTLWERLKQAFHLVRKVADNHIVGNAANTALRFYPEPSFARALARLHGLHNIRLAIRDCRAGYLWVQGRNENDIRLMPVAYWPFIRFTVGLNARITVEEYERRYRRLADIQEGLFAFRSGPR